MADEPDITANDIKAAAEKAAAEVEASRKSAEQAVQEQGGSATKGIAKGAQSVTEDGAQAASDVGSWFSDVFKNSGKKIKELSEKTSGWGIVGIAGGALLAWTIGNAFSGGGLLGMIVSACLAFLFIPAAIDFATGSLAPAVKNAQADTPQKSAQLGQSQAPVIEGQDAQAIEHARLQSKRLQGKEAVQFSSPEATIELAELSPPALRGRNSQHVRS